MYRSYLLTRHTASCQQSAWELAAAAGQSWFQSSHRGHIMPVDSVVPIINGVMLIGVGGSNRLEEDLLCCRAAMAVWEHAGH